VPSQDQKPNNIIIYSQGFMVFRPTTMPFFGLVPLQNPKASNITIFKFI
jgi:hypothetical protein